MKTFATMYGGGEGAGLGARAAGLKHLWGIEYSPDIAAVAEANGFEMVVASTLTVNYKHLPAPFWLHASPPCVTASVANAKAGESLMDTALAAAVCEAIDALRPEWFSLENVSGYRSYASYAAIKETLEDAGYKTVEGIINAADMGVPQTRRRLFLVASRMGTPVLPRPTHTDKHEVQQLDLFAPEPLKPWVGWYEAIEDLIPSLPESRLAKWQLERLPNELATTLMGDQRGGGEWAALARPTDSPVYTLDTRPAGNHKALLIDGKMNAYGESVTVRNGDAPAFTAVAQNTTRQPLTAVVIGSNIAGTTRKGEERLFTLAADNSEGGRVKAVLCPPNYRTWELDTPPLSADMPAYTVTATIGNKTAVPTAIAGRVVRLTPAALARLQGVPRDYALPDDRRLAGRVIGNMVPPPVMQAIIEANL